MGRPTPTAHLSPQWKRFSTSTKDRAMPAHRSFVLTKPSNSSSEGAPVAMKPGQAERYDYEYARNGTATMFMMFAPLEGWRHVQVTDRHTALDFAHGSYRTFILPMLPSSPWFKTILAPTNRLRYTKRFRLPRRDAWPGGSNGFTRPNTAVGSIWPSPNLAFFHPNAWIGTSRTNRRSSTKPGKPPQPAPCHRRLAVHNRRCTH